jgi:hypothetical protein
MEERRWLARYLAVATVMLAGLVWLLLFTLSRLAAAPNLEGVPRSIIEAVGRVGVFLVSPAFLVVAAYFLLSVVYIGTSAAGRAMEALAIYLGVFGGVAVAHALFPTLIWLNIVFTIVSLAATLWLVARHVAYQKVSTTMRAGVLLVGAAYISQSLFVLQQNVGIGKLLGEQRLAVLQAGELLAVMAPFAFFAAVAVPFRQWQHARRWVLPIALTGAFSAASVADMVFNQGFTGVMTIWSTGMQLYLPWPLYAISLGLFAYSVLTCFYAQEPKARFADPNTGVALLLILFTGYRLLLPYQHLLAILSLILLTGLSKPFAADESKAYRVTPSQTAQDLSEGGAMTGATLKSELE